MTKETSSSPLSDGIGKTLDGRRVSFASEAVLGNQVFQLSAAQLSKEKAAKVSRMQNEHSGPSSPAKGQQLKEQDKDANWWLCTLAVNGLHNKSYLRIKKRNEAGLSMDMSGKHQGPYTLFDMYFMDSAQLESVNVDVIEVQLRSRVLGAYFDLEKTTGNLVPVREPATLRLVVKRSSWVGSLWEAWIGTAGEDSSLQLNFRSTGDFWRSIGWALLASFGSNLFWVGTWTLWDQGTWTPSNARDAAFVVVGLASGFLTDRLGLSYYKAPIHRLREASSRLQEKAEQDSIARELAKMSEKRQTDGKLAAVAKLAQARSQQMERRVKEARSCWTRCVTLTGNLHDDTAAIHTFQYRYKSVIGVLGLFGGVFLWVGACNLLSIPLGDLQGLIPTDNWYGQVAFDVGVVALSFYLMQASSSLGRRAGSEPREQQVSSSQQQGMQQSNANLHKMKCQIELLTWAVVVIDVVAGLLLWIGMCDLLGTQFATRDSDGDNSSFGYADDEESMWAQLFYISLGLLCQISTELITAEALSEGKSPDDFRFLPTLFDVASVLGGVFLNNGMWTLIDTNLSTSWEYCSYDGSGGGEGWPSCEQRNLFFSLVGFAILCSQHQLLQEAGVDSSPVMVLAVARPRKQARIDMNRRVNEQHRDSVTITGSLAMQCPIEEASQMTEDLVDYIAETLAVPEERVKVTVTACGTDAAASICNLEVWPMRTEVASVLAHVDATARQLILQEQREVLRKLTLSMPTGRTLQVGGPLSDALLKSIGDFGFQGLKQRSRQPRGLMRKLSNVFSTMRGAEASDGKGKGGRKGKAKGKGSGKQPNAAAEPLLASEAN